MGAAYAAMGAPAAVHTSHTSAYVAYVAYVRIRRIRPYTSAYVRIRRVGTRVRRASAYVAAWSSRASRSERMRDPTPPPEKERTKERV